jgi:hypothetical protein
MDGVAIEQLLALDPAGLSRDELLDGLEELESLLRRVQARRERFLAPFYDPNDTKRWLREEVGCLLRWNLGYTQSRLAQAEQVVRTLPRLLALHEAGEVDEAHLRAAADLTGRLDAAVVARVEDRVLGRAPEQTPASFRASVRRAIAREDPRGAEDRHKDAVRHDKTVSLCPLPDGMAGIWSVHTAVDAEAIMAALTERARIVDDGQGIDARRADALVDAVLGQVKGVTARCVRAQVLIPAAVADGDSDGPAELVGYGPIPGSLARLLLADPSTRIERIHLDRNGRVLAPHDIDCDKTSRCASARLARYLVAAWPTCRFPGCNRRATGCELDHIECWNGCNTTAANMEPLCPRHHHLKHEAGWQVWRDADGVTHWLSPGGRHYRKPPDELPGCDP